MRKYILFGVLCVSLLTASLASIRVTSPAGSSLPDQSASAGLFLTTDGSNPSWGTPAGGGGGSAKTTVFLSPDAMDFPPSSNDMWIHIGDMVNGAPATAVPSNDAITAVSLSAVVTSGRTAIVDVPASATKVSFNFTARGVDQEAGDVQMFVAVRELSITATVPSWSVYYSSAWSNNVSGLFTQLAWKDTLANFGLTAGKSYQIAVGRATGGATDTYASGWLLTMTRIELE